MAKLSLSRERAKVLPELVDDDGTTVPVDADFRTILKCFRVLSDSSIAPHHRILLLRKWFYKDASVSDPVGLFRDFVMDSTVDEQPERVMDFEQDADAIYSSFMQVYGIDLFDVGFLHWAKFLALLGGIGEKTALGNRISIRTLDTRKMEPRDRARFEKLKRSVALKVNELPMTEEETHLIKAVDDALAAGKDASSEIKALNDYYKRTGGDELG